MFQIFLIWHAGFWNTIVNSRKTLEQQNIRVRGSLRYRRYSINKMKKKKKRKVCKRSKEEIGQHTRVLREWRKVRATCWAAGSRWWRRFRGTERSLVVHRSRMKRCAELSPDYCSSLSWRRSSWPQHRDCCPSDTSCRLCDTAPTPTRNRRWKLRISTRPWLVGLAANSTDD